MVAKIAQLLAVLGLCCALASALPTSRVVGGENANIGQFPHQVSLFNQNQFTCGGSIISSTYILTAAHCVVVGSGIEPLPAFYFTVRVGSIQRLAAGEVHDIAEVKVRKSYGNFLDDVALLRLKNPLKFTNNIQPISLFEGELPEGTPVVVSGWGRLYHGGPIPSHLQWNTLEAISQDTCNEKNGWGKDQILCLAHEKDNGVCNGDSGGPATFEGKLVGVAGFVYGGCGNIYPDGYAKVSYHIEWIQENMI